MLIAITREVSPRIIECELTHRVREPINLARARAQHQQYEDLLGQFGCEVQRLPAEPDLPDSVFVEDAAIVLDELAVITRPGSKSRRAETTSVARALKRYRPLYSIHAPGTLDGGDVLRVGRTVYVGASARSNASGIGQLAALLGRFDYEVRSVAMRGGLHLKSAATQVNSDTLLINPDWVDRSSFRISQYVLVDPGEPQGANALHVGGAVVYPASCDRTRGRLENAGITVVTVDMSEIEKAEGGVTCCSLMVDVPN